MSATLDDKFDLFPEEEWYEVLIRYGLYVGAAFQILCILAIVVFPPSSSDQAEESQSGASGDSGSSDNEEDEDSGLNSPSYLRPNSRKKLEKKKRK